MKESRPERNTGPRAFRVTLVIFLCLAANVGRAQEALPPLRDEWRHKQYSRVLPQLMEYRERSYGRDPEVDYMIATCMCRIPAYHEKAPRWFQWILDHHQLSGTATDKIKSELEKCKPEEPPVYVVFTALRGTSGGSGAHVGGKMYYAASKNTALTSNPVRVIRDIPPKELQQRLFPLEQTEDALRHVPKVVGSPVKTASTPHFVVVSLAGQSAKELQTIGATLEGYLNFYVSNYRMPLPTHLITVYLTPDSGSLQKLAAKLHGIEIPIQTLGYSFRDDQSVAAITPGTIIGTLKHELFHLMVRYDFGDVPPWLDEGIAALYEVSRVEGEHVVGLPNWRGRVLGRFWHGKPAIENLVTMNWRAFDNVAQDPMATQQAVNHAVARYFMLYLQKKGKLRDVYFAFQNLQPEQTTGPVQILEKVLEKPIKDISAEFEHFVWSTVSDNTIQQ